MSFDLPPVFGHRGARAVRTENTLGAFRYACTSGIRWVELDVMLSRDGVPMVFHDETLDRLSETKGRLDSFTAAGLKDVRLAGGAGIPTLDEVLRLLNECGGCVNIEIKPSRPDLARETARTAWRVVCENGFDDPSRLLFSSFAWDALEEMAELAPAIRRGVLVEEDSADWRPVAEKIGAYSIHYDADLLTEPLIREIRGQGYRLLAYTVNEPEKAQMLREWGVESFFCDSPVEMMQAMT